MKTIKKVGVKKKLQEQILSYFAVFEQDLKSGYYDVSFPDFPGCVTFGKNFEEAKEKAQEVLELWLEELVSKKEEIPLRVLRPIIDEITVTLPYSFFRKKYHEIT
ncbi:MAG: type II toxin-antitoxin system HicB family antitoxin [Patescibacteria group bacterium]